MYTPRDEIEEKTKKKDDTSFDKHHKQIRAPNNPFDAMNCENCQPAR